ncbi:glycosyltransferase family 2 protein [Lihuaxuella thermophila]|uniref:Glycosyl transferase family 2 n=1 Tax=Lihuaxuella thermophila TaxID=1173111 RepID=A0A1H8DYB9_9BACL|nr:glycosyltransferase [Lihuaxuella thermophila]SEN12203.1 Glycosyl transferase family 2 [Lihuaxuella thermophila]
MNVWQNKMPKVSIVIPFYNCPYIDQAIESALNQSYPCTEILVINDGSTRYKEKVVPYFNHIRYVEKANGGTASALNCGIQHATGEYFTWLSSDDLYKRDKVAKQVSLMQQNNAHVSYTSFFFMNSNNQYMGSPGQVKFANKIEFYQTMLKGCPINGCTVMLKMEVFSKVGLFDVTLRYTQDYDMWLRVLQKYEFYYLDEPLVLYRVHEEMGTKKYAREIPLEINLVQQRHRAALERLIAEELKK